MNLIDFIFSIYKDIISGEKTFFKKFYIFIFILLGLYLTDNLFGFSYYHSINAKIEKTREINTILKDSALLNKNEIISFKTFRNEIINRKTFKDNAYSFLSNISFKSIKNPITTKPTETKPIIERNLNIHFITSASSILFVMIVIFFAGLADKTSKISQRIAIIIVCEAMLYPFALLFSKTLYLIPVINEEPIINYILNVFLSFFVPFILAFITTKINNK